MSARYDAIVIGGGVGGLTAASYLKIAGLDTLLLEASATLGGRKAPMLSALDPRVVKELGLARRGLSFSARDLLLASLRQDGRHLVLPRDPHAASRAIAAHSPVDAAAYMAWHAELFALARTLRPFWWEAEEVPRGLPSKLAVQSASAWLGSWFESEIVKSALCADVPDPLVPGSALALVWRGAQEMGGLQGAVAACQGLGDALIAAAKDEGVEFRTQARVAKLVLDDAVAGVVLESGETIHARKVLSSLSRRETLLTLAPTAAAGFAETERLARGNAHRETEILFTLNAAAEFPVPSEARFVVPERALEAFAPASSQPGQYALFVRGGVTADEAIRALERFTPHLRSRIVGQAVSNRALGPAQLLKSARARIATPIAGLFLCGSAAEPLDATSGRAGRLAASFAIREKAS